MQLELRHVTYIYDKDVKNPKKAVNDVSLKLNKGEFVGLIGHTGSGKSTLVQFLNGLLEPTEGEVLLDGKNIQDKDFSKKTLRQRVGLVFQYPEYQLFEETVLKDVCFGPANMGLPKEEQEKRAKEALAAVGLTEEDYEKSPFDLSGGQKRRVAIAGVLAMGPDIIVLDEPSAGLDPEGRDEILSELGELNKKSGIGIVLVSHSMEDVARFADRLLVMNNGCLVYDDKPRNVFREYEKLETMGLSAPQVTYVVHTLKNRGFNVDTDAMTVEEAKETILKALEERKK